jgi:hypothetical protein
VCWLKIPWRPNGQERIELVLVALHEDLYNADGIIHETVAELSEMKIKEIVSIAGCEVP